MLYTKGIDPSVKNFRSLTNSLDHLWKKADFWQIVSIHRLKIFVSSDNHQSNQCFCRQSIIGIDPIEDFFYHRCPTMLTRWHPTGGGAGFKLGTFELLNYSQGALPLSHWWGEQFPRARVRGMKVLIYAHWAIFSLKLSTKLTFSPSLLPAYRLHTYAQTLWSIHCADSTRLVIQVLKDSRPDRTF